MAHRDDLVERATDYALEHGLIGLSLRPLAAAIGTSDRMLIYHLGSKDELVAAILTTSNHRSVTLIRSLVSATSVRQAVVDLWDLFAEGQLQQCQRMYVEAAALGLFGREPYSTSVRDSNAVWMEAIAQHLRRSGAAVDDCAALAAVVDATFNGLLLDAPLDGDAESRRVVERLASSL